MKQKLLRVIPAAVMSAALLACAAAAEAAPEATVFPSEEELTVMDTLTGPALITQPGAYRLSGNGVTICNNPVTVDADGEVYILLDNVMIEDKAAFTILNGDVTLALVGDSSLESTGYFAGIHCGGGSLVITSADGDGDTYGTLFASSETSAGIGGSYDDSFPSQGAGITIRGGTVTARGGEMSAGIGGAPFGAGSSITITGGEVYAYGGDGGAGIGGGGYEPGADIEITGGSVIAAGGKKAAGIGGGMGAGSAENIVISGGTVAAIGGEQGAGIGGGNEGGARAISLTGGTVKALGGSGAAGIGGGQGGSAEDISASQDAYIASLPGSGCENAVGGGAGGASVNCFGQAGESRTGGIFGGALPGYIIIAAAALLIGGWGMAALAKPKKKNGGPESSGSDA